MAQINHIRFIERIKIYWEKFESRKPTIQCFRCHAHSHTSANCNKKAVCVKCAGEHESRSCKKTLDVPPTCANCKGNHPVNFSQCPALLAFLAKKNAHSTTMKPTRKLLFSPPQLPNFPYLPYKKSEHPNTKHWAPIQHHYPPTCRTAT